MMFSKPPPASQGPTAPRPVYNPQSTPRKPVEEVRHQGSSLPTQPSAPQGQTNTPSVSINFLC